MENKSIDQLLKELADLTTEARSSLFGQDKCMVDRERLLSLTEEIQSSLPKELREAQTVVSNSAAIRQRARDEAAQTRKQADQVLKEAEQRAAKLIEENTIVTLAERRAEEIEKEAAEKLEDGKRQRDAIIASAVKYCDRLMAETADSVQTTLTTLDSGYAALKKASHSEFEQAAAQIAQARKDLKNTDHAKRMQEDAAQKQTKK